MVSEEIYQSLHNRENNVKIEKDNNNNTTITTPSTKVLKIDKTAAAIQKQQPIEIDRASKSVKIVENKIHSKASEQSSTAPPPLQSGMNTLKRKREAKSPTKQTTTVESSKKQQHDTQPTSPNQTIATILVSKTKTKSGLPLLLKKT